MDVFARLGFSETTRTQLGTVSITPRRMNIAARFAGEEHILRMGDHYREYSGNLIPQFTNTSNFPIPQPVVCQPQKERSQGVSGNIGEAVTNIALRSLFRLGVNEIFHITVRGNCKLPDCLAKIGTPLTNKFSAWPPTVTNFPQAWPVECKSSFDASSSSPSKVRAALEQLASYWFLTRNHSSGAHVGYGIVSSIQYLQSHEKVLWSVFVPNNQTSLLKFLNTFSDYQAFRSSAKWTETMTEISGNLHG